MTTGYFADSFYFIAILNPKDQYHKIAHERASKLKGMIFTTDAVLLEVGDALCDPQDRLEVSNFIRTLWINPNVNVIEISRDLLDRSLTLFQSRLDKEWTFTDCISFTVMKKNGITEALTGDHHFTQAGFKILLI